MDIQVIIVIIGYFVIQVIHNENNFDNEIGSICCWGDCTVIDNNNERKRDIVDPLDSINCAEYIENTDYLKLLLKIERYTEIQRWCLFSLLSFAFILLLSSFIYYQINRSRQRAFDTPDYLSIFRLIQNFGDFGTDIFFSVILYLESRIILFILSVLSISIPFLVSAIVSVY